MTKKNQGAAGSGLGSISLDQLQERTRRMREAMGPKRARRSLNALFGFLTSSDEEETNGSDGDHENTQNTGSQPEVQSQRRTGTEEEGAQQDVEESMKTSSDEEEFRVEARRKKPRLRQGKKLRDPEAMKFDSSDEEEAPVEARRKKPRLGEEKKLGDLETTMYFDMRSETSFLLNIVEFHKAKKVYPFSSTEAMDEFIKYWTRPIDLPHPSQIIMEKIKYAEKSFEERDKRYHLQGNVLKSEEELAHHLGEHIWGSKFKKDDDAIGVGDDIGYDDDDVGVGDDAIGVGDVGVGDDVGDEEEGQQVGLEQKDLAKYPNLVKGLNKIPKDYHAIWDEAIVSMEESELEDLDKQWEQLQKEKAELNEKQQGMIIDLISAMQNAVNSKT